ncbi:Uncharacterized protein PECH_004811 [Penicillium ucsense]|uniref:stearoyl-CoA 9-desaturase n=1 Tax=Penicillium ucsense TaxID=2839758 RepID=A0A8J8WCA5_9EURO|nr:Uncharacterized protein PECM_007553 [Penicillium ucsense]KAF7739327.1 Uncharacterized protein PECH_004811 [Penicillium ucsense]
MAASETGGPRSKTTHNIKKPHITEQPVTLQNWYQHINWLSVFFIIVSPCMGLVAAYHCPLKRATAAFAIFYYFNTGLGITAGKYINEAFPSPTVGEASTPLKIYLAAAGVSAVQGSIRWWSRGHRAHHRYTDTEKDPYSVYKGFWYSYLGWMVMKQNPKYYGRADITDLNEDTVVATFCVNSLAHWLGDQPFDDRNSPRDHVITALVTLGDGYHNFHHEFPSDYRNAIEWWQYDPTKWAIWTWKQLGLVYNLKEFKANEIEKGRLQQLQKKLDIKRSTLDWGIPISQLPVMTWDDFKAESAKSDGRALVAIAGVVHDVAHFIKEHPGGKAFIASAIGKDATATFNGGVYQHSNAAHNLLSTMRNHQGDQIVQAGGQTPNLPLLEQDVTVF